MQYYKENSIEMNEIYAINGDKPIDCNKAKAMFNLYLLKSILLFLNK